MGPGRVTLANVIAQVRQASDLENNEFITDLELTSKISSSSEELYDLLVSAYGEEYALTSTTFVTTTEQAYALPDDVYKLDSLEVTSSEGYKRPLKRLPWAERDDDQRQAPVRSYAVRGEQVYLFPPPIAGQTVTLWYVPRPAPLAASGTVQLLPEFAQGNTLTLDDIQLSAQLWGTFGTAVSVIFASTSSATVDAGYSYTDLDGTEWITAATFATPASAVAAWEANHSYSIFATVYCDNAVLSCEQSTAPTGTSVTASFLGELIVDGGVHWRVIGLGSGVTRVYTATMFSVNHDMCLAGRISSTTQVPAGISSVYNRVNASYYAPPTVPGTVFGLWYERLDLTAKHLASRISLAGKDPTSALYGLAATSGTTTGTTTTVTITSARPYRCDLTGMSATVYAPLERWANYLDGISGWEEYVVTDCTIKAKLKDEQDVSPEMAQKEALRQRIIRLSKHRDRGPQRPSDTWGMRGQRPWPYGGGLR